MQKRNFNRKSLAKGLYKKARLGQLPNFTGVDSAYSSEWYFGKYGWIAFGHDWVDYTYTEWVKNNPSSFSTAVGGWMPTTISPPQKSGTNI